MFRSTAMRSTQPQRWQSREKILKAHLDGLSPDELRRVRPDYYWLRFGQAAWIRNHARKANFNLNQPRVPAGNSDGGQWTDTGGGQFNPPDDSDSIEASAVRRRGPRDLLPFPHFSVPGESVSPREPIRSSIVLKRAYLPSTKLRRSSRRHLRMS